MKKIIFILLFGIITGNCYAVEVSDNSIATSLKYVGDELSTKQDEIPAENGTKALTFTNVSGGLAPREVKTALGNSTSDNSLPTVGAVNDGLDTKQDEIPAKNTNTVLTYGATPGTVGEKGIYQDSGSYSTQSNSLIDAGTFNAALKNGLDNEFVCADHMPDTEICWLWSIDNPMPSQFLPTGYTELKYIESDGTQWIDANVKPANDIGTFVQVMWLQASSPYAEAQVMGSKGGGTVRFYTPCLYNGKAVYGWNGFVTTDIDINLGIIYDVKLNYNNNRKAEVDANVIGNISTNLGSSSANLTLFGATYEPRTMMKGRIYKAQITQQTNIIRNFIPAWRNSDDVIGMYDTVSGQFFTNAGTGAFIAGPVVENIYIPQNQ